MTTPEPSRPNASAPAGNWAEANQSYLWTRLELVRRRLEQEATGQPATPDPALDERLEQAVAALDSPAALDQLCALFQLSPFERDVLVLCAGPELDGSFAELVAGAQRDPRRTQPSFSLALTLFSDAHWSALHPGAPLRRWRLLEPLAGGSLTTSPLRIDERVLHHLTGITYLHERLIDFVEPLSPGAPLVPSHRRVADQIVRLWSRLQPGARGDLPPVQLCGDEPDGGRTIATHACNTLRLGLLCVRARAMPAGPETDELLVLLWREAALTQSAVLFDCHGLARDEPGRDELRLLDRAQAPVLVTTPARLRSLERPSVVLDVGRPTTVEQRTLWIEALRRHAGIEAPAATVEALVSQFDLGDATIDEACVQLDAHAVDVELEDQLWARCRTLCRPRLGDLAQRIESLATWDDLILPEPQMQLLHELCAQLRLRSRVYETWALAAKSSRGLGITAMFAGPSGTGKTLAAEVIANTLRLDLHRIDLSQVVNKYIGETEKNLRRIFDAAESGGTLLLFDEADALFGKRSEVSDARDRYANIEVSYLLQRMEAYRGLAILTTNMKSALDEAFLRRIRFVVEFPFPGPEQRRELWQRVFPPEVPTEALDFDKLTELNVTGGNIRNIALNAAFLAADADARVGMQHLWRAARSEHAKLEMPLPAPLRQP